MAISQDPNDPNFGLENDTSSPNFGLAVQEPSQTGGVGGFVGGVGQALLGAVKGLIPTSGEQLAEMGSPLVGGVKAITETVPKLANIAFGGKTIAEEFPQGKTYPEFTATDWGKFLGEIGVNVGMAALLKRGLTKPTLSETAGITETKVAPEVPPEPPVSPTDVVAAETIAPTTPPVPEAVAPVTAPLSTEIKPTEGVPNAEQITETTRPDVNVQLPGGAVEGEVAGGAVPTDVGGEGVPPRGQGQEVPQEVAPVLRTTITTNAGELPIRDPSENVTDALKGHTETPAGARIEYVNINDIRGGVTREPRVKEITQQMGGENGYISRVIVDANNDVVEGQHRLEALRNLGATEVPVVKIFGAEDFIPDVGSVKKVIKDSGITKTDQVNQMVSHLGETLMDENGNVAELRNYDPPQGFEKPWNAAVAEIERQNPAPPAAVEPAAAPAQAPAKGDLWYSGVGPEGETTWVTSNLEKAKIYAGRRGAGGRINVYTPDQVGETAFADQEGNLISPQEYAKTQSEDTTLQVPPQAEGQPLPKPIQTLDATGKPIAQAPAGAGQLPKLGSLANRFTETGTTEARIAEDLFDRTNPDREANIAQEFDLNTVTKAQADKAAQEVQAHAQWNLRNVRKLPETITVYRAGPITGDVVGVTLDRNVARRHGERSGEPVVAYQVARDNILADVEALRPEGYQEKEMLVHPEHLTKTQPNAVPTVPAREAVAPAGAGEAPPPAVAAPPTAAPEPVPTTGVNAAAMAERPIEAPPPGEVVGWDENRLQGHEWLDAGGDPQTIIQKFADTDAVSTPDMGRMRAALERLQQGTNVAGDALRKDPGNPELEQAYQEANSREQQFSDVYKPMHTFASANLASLQGKVPLTEDAAQSFTGMHRDFQANQGREFTPQEATKAETLVDKNTEAAQKYKAENENLFNTIDKELESTPSKIRGRAPTLQELGEMFSEKLKEVCDL